MVLVSAGSPSRESNGFYTTVELNGQPTRLMVDTGAGRSVLSAATWRKIGRPWIKAAEVKLFTFTGEEIALLGKIDLEMQLKGETTRREFVVCCGTDHDIMGRDLIETVVPELRERLKQLGAAPGRREEEEGESEK